VSLAPLRGAADPLSRIARRRVTSESFGAARARFAALYLSSFPREERRRIGGAPHEAGEPEDDGLLPGATVADRLAAPGCRLEGYFDGGRLVGAMLSLELGRYSLGDYMVRDPARLDLSGLGGRMLRDWLAQAAAADKDALAEVEPPLPLAPDADLAAEERALRAAQARTRRRRRLFFTRHGFEFADAVGYALPSGVPMSLAIRRRPSRGRAAVPAEELAAMAAAVAATYV
jgi:hypothetical protein